MVGDSRLERFADWVVGLVSPRRAALRRHARRYAQDEGYRSLVDAIGRARSPRTRGYAAAADSETKTPWDDALWPRSADAELLYHLPRLRARSRQASRDDAIGSGLIGSRVRKVVGTGLRAQSRTGDRDKDARIEEVWGELSRNLAPADGLDYGALQRMRYRRVLEDGEVFVKLTYFPDLGLRTETVEAERVQTPPERQGKGIWEGIDWTTDGVEKTGAGVPIAYWVLRVHPGDLWTPMAQKLTYVRVPAEECYHARRVERPGQTRGLPLFHAILQDLRDLDLFILASLKRCQIAASLALFIESSSETADILPVTNNSDYGARLDQDIEPGMMWKLLPGERVSTLTPNFSAPELEPFVILLARRIGAAVGVSWQTVLQDWGGSNYSSARTQILEDRQTYAIDRAEFTALLQWERKALLQAARLGDARLAGVTDADLDATAWIADAQPWVDPQKEAVAVQIQLQAGLTCLRDEAGKLGQDWEELLRQRLEEERVEKELRAELGLEKPKPPVVAVVKPGAPEPEKPEPGEEPVSGSDGEEKEEIGAAADAGAQ